MLALRKVIPYTWLVDPEPLPRHAVLPRLETHTWDEVAHFSQKQRALILKISGFFGARVGLSRGVVVADMSQTAWKAAETQSALAEFSTHPHILQQFYQGRLIGHDYFDPTVGELRRMRGRVRLCPTTLSEKRRDLVAPWPQFAPMIRSFARMTDAILVPRRLTSQPKRVDCFLLLTICHLYFLSPFPATQSP